MERIVQFKSAARSNLIAVAGGAVGGVLGYILGFLVAIFFVPDSAGLDWIGYLLLAMAVGVWVGATAGVAVGLRLTGRGPLSSPFFWTLAALLPLGGAGTWLGVSFNDYDDNMPLFVEYGIPVVAVGLSIYFGIWMARRFQKVTPSHRRAD